MLFLARHWRELWSGGFTVIPKKTADGMRLLATVAVTSLNAVWAVPAVILIRLLRRFHYFSSGTVDSSRVGAFVGDAILFFLTAKPGKKRTALLWYARPPANEQWDRMLRRTFVVGNWVKHVDTFNRLLPGGRGQAYVYSGIRDLTGLLESNEEVIEFTWDEEERAKTWLRRRGWRDGEPFVCLLARDSAYLDSYLSAPPNSNEGWSYHDYRDSDIALFVEAVQALTHRGYWVIRMGKIMRQPFPGIHERIIDYPFVEDKDDLLDIWLSANCFFFISTSAGLDHAAIGYRRPVCLVNFLPLSDAQTWVDMVVAPKWLRWKQSGCRLTMAEMLEHSHHRTAHYARAGILIEDLTPSQLRDAVLECEGRITGTWLETPSEAEAQRRFWSLFKSWPMFGQMHGAIHPKARVARSWLEDAGADLLADASSVLYRSAPLPP